MDLDFNSSPGFMIGRVAHLLRTAISQAVSEAGISLSPEETQVLLRLHNAKCEMRMTELADGMMRDATTLTRQVDGLVRKKILARTISPQDRRVIMVGVTAEGEKVVKQLLPILKSIRKRKMRSISAENEKILIETLQRIKDNLSAS